MTDYSDTAKLKQMQDALGVKLIDDKHLQFTLTDPAPYFPYILALWVGYPSRQDMVEMQTCFEHNEARIDCCKNVFEMIPIHFDVNGANGRAIRHHPEITGQMLDGVVCEKRHPIIGRKAPLAQVRGDAAGQLAELAVTERAAVFDRDDAGLVRMAPGRSIDPILKQQWARPRRFHYRHRPPSAS